MPWGEEIPEGAWFRRHRKGFEVGARIWIPVYALLRIASLIILSLFVAAVPVEEPR